MRQIRDKYETRIDTTRHQVAMTKEDMIDIERRPLGKKGLHCIHHTRTRTHAHAHTHTRTHAHAHTQAQTQLARMLLCTGSLDSRLFLRPRPDHVTLRVDEPGKESHPASDLRLGAVDKLAFPSTYPDTGRIRFHSHGSLPAKLDGLLKCLGAVDDAQGRQNWTRPRVAGDVVDDLILPVHVQESSVKSLALGEEVHALDTVANGLAGLVGKFPSEELGVELLGARDIKDGHFQPADLAKGFLWWL